MKDAKNCKMSTMVSCVGFIMAREVLIRVSDPVIQEEALKIPLRFDVA